MIKEMHSLANYFNTRVQTSSNPYYANGYTTQNNESGKFYEEVVAELNQLHSFKTQTNLLEIGCGTGEILSRLQIQGLQVQGLDISEMMVNISKKNGLDVTHYKGSTLPFTNESFDTILIYQVITNFPTVKSVTKLIGEANRVLKKGGALIIGAIPHSKLSNCPTHSNLNIKSIYSKFRSLTGKNSIGYFSFAEPYFLKLFDELNFSSIKFARCGLSRPGWNTKYHVIMEKK